MQTCLQKERLVKFTVVFGSSPSKLRPRTCQARELPAAGPLSQYRRGSRLCTSRALHVSGRPSYQRTPHQSSVVPSHGGVPSLGGVPSHGGMPSHGAGASGPCRAAWAVDSVPPDLYPQSSDPSPLDQTQTVLEFVSSRKLGGGCRVSASGCPCYPLKIWRHLTTCNWDWVSESPKTKALPGTELPKTCPSLNLKQKEQWGPS